MKIAHAKFSRLIASGAYTITSAHKAIFGEKKNNGAKGSQLMKREDVQRYIADLQAMFNKRIGIDADWIRKQLVDEIVEDTGNKLKAIDTLNKMNGWYLKDNEQKQQDVQLNMTF